MKSLIVTLFLFIGFLFSSYVLAFETKPVRKDHVSVSIVSEYDSISSDLKDFKLAVKFKIDPHWHIYWKNPGDSGTAPKVEWIHEGSLNFHTFEWPLPSAIPIEPLLNYGYEKTILLPLNVEVKEPISTKHLNITAKLSWLICKVECIPGKAEIDFQIPVKQNKISEESNAIYRALSHVPIKKHDIKFKSLLEDDKINLVFTSQNIIFESYDKFYFFPNSGTFLDHAKPQIVSFDKNKNLILQLEKSENFQGMPSKVDGVLSLDRKGEPKISFELSSSDHGKASTPYLLILFFAFVGGMILNLMPCVFPVISIKILSFVQASKETHTKLSHHGWAYTLGILISFLALSGALLTLRALGENLGWGFQLQSPYFIVFMIILFYLMALNLFGLFEVGENLAGVGGKLQRGKDLRASFFTGILATTVATPCTAPFMGPALGVAVTLPVVAALLVFLMIGVGMAFPYLLLTYSPKLLKFLPKPGPWMKRFKQILGIPMLVTVGWLFWVLSFQVHMDLVMYVVGYLLLFGSVIWLNKISKSPSMRGLAIVVMLIASGVLLKQVYYRLESSKNISNMDSNWAAFSEQEIESLKQSNQPYFIDFTAAWCLTCQVNKKLVLNTVEIQNEFKKRNVKLIKADWTNQDAVITKALERYKRNSVPVYVLYNPKTSSETILPEILTDQIVLDSLESLD